MPNISQGAEVEARGDPTARSVAQWSGRRPGCPATMKLFLSLAACLITPGAGTVGRPAPPPPQPSFGFSPVLGDWMVLQQSPAAAAVYGVAPESATGVTVTVSDGKNSYDVVAKVGKDATHQPHGYVDPGTGANLPVQNFTWKAVLHPVRVCCAFSSTTRLPIQH